MTKEYKYKDGKVFAWVNVLGKAVPQIWGEDFADSASKQNPVLFRVALPKEQLEMNIDQLVSIYPAPTEIAA